MRLLAVGAGSIGGYFGGRLAKAGRDVTFLVRSARRAQLLAGGLQVVSPWGEFTIAPKMIGIGEIEAPYDAVLIAVKGYSLKAALEDMALAVGPETMVIPVLNGMKYMDILRERFGERSLIGAVCLIPAMLDPEGRIVHLSKVHELVYGELSGASSTRIQELDAFMSGAGFDNRLSNTIEREMWEKWVLLASLSGINCLMRGTIGDVAAVPGGVEFASRFLDEVVSIIRVVGIAPSEKFLANTRAQLTRNGSGMTSSVYRDLQSGNRLEADQILGDLLARGQRANVPTPLLAAAYTHLCLYQSRLAAQE